jgi:hypothetical protein
LPGDADPERNVVSDSIHANVGAPLILAEG